jgi:SAM-dependent methyltransferase
MLSESGRLSMDALGEVMDAVGDSVTPVNHYDELAAVYDFVIARRYDFDAMVAFTAKQLPSDAKAVCVGGSGPGRLLARLADRYEEAVGVDLSPAMCELAVARTDAEVVEADVVEYRRQQCFDGYTLLGNSLAHLPAGDISSFFETVRECLTGGGVLLVDFTLATTLSNGHLRADSFTSGRHRVDRRVMVTVEDRESEALGTPARYTYGYDITDGETDETVTTGTSVTVRTFDPPELLGAAVGAGFTEVALVDPPTPHGGGLIARRPA